MTSMRVAPRPIINAQKNPRRAPSFMIVRLTGPTGIDRSKPLRKPVRPASRMGERLAMRALGRRSLFSFFLVFLLDFPSHLAGDARADETVHEVKREESRQHVIEDLLPQDQNEAQE